MSKYRRTIVTLDDTQTKKDYMLFCVFEKLWPDMVTPSPQHMHPKGKDFNNDGRFDICVHVDEVDITANVEDAPLPHVVLQGKVEMLWGDMRRDPDPGNHGFMLKKGSFDIDSVTDMLPESQSVQQTWAWFDLQRLMYNFLGTHNINLNKVGAFTKKHLGINLADNPLHIGCIYVVHYSPIKAVHVETVPMMPAVRCEIDWRVEATKEDVYVKVTEKVTDKQSTPNVFTQQVTKGQTFALVHMGSRPRRIDLDVENGAGEVLFFLRSIVFFGSTMSFYSNQRQKKQPSPVPVKTVGLEHYLRTAILEKEAKIKRSRMEFVYFDGDPTKKAENQKEAKDCVKKMLGRAKKHLMIADPYFATDQFNENIMPLASEKDLEITIVNCKEQLEIVAHGLQKQFQDIENELKALVASFNANANGNKVTIYCVTGKGRLHDRFVLTEGEGWQIGSSLSEFGNRACCIIKLFDSACMELDNLLCGWCNDGNVSYKME